MSPGPDLSAETKAAVTGLVGCVYLVRFANLVEKPFYFAVIIRQLLLEERLGFELREHRDGDVVAMHVHSNKCFLLL